MAKPNILFIMADQHRWDALGCTGGWVRTPNLDRIAGEGVRFSNCVTTTPVCIPARVSLATGLYPHNNGVWNNMGYTMPAEAPTWMRAIREAGYRTSLFGKTHLHPHQGDLREREDLMHAYGLDDVNEIGGPRASARVLSHMTAEWEQKGLWEAYRQDYQERFSTRPQMVRPSPLGLESYYDVYVGRQAKQYLEAYAREEPWFCWVSFGGPHEPWDAPEPYDRLYDPASMPPPVPPAEGRADRPKGALDGREPRDFEPGEVARMRANYAGEVTLIDEQIGELLKVVEARGELENTVIAFSSDHGEMNGDHGLIYKSTFLNGAVRVPMVVRTPDTAQSSQAGAVSDSPAEWIDLGPTLAELAGAELDYQQFGKSFGPVLANPETGHRDEAISEIGGEMMIMNKEWKMALNASGQPYLLFDVQNDPDESRNLAGKPEMKGVETALRLRMLERLVQTQWRL